MKNDGFFILFCLIELYWIFSVRSKGLKGFTIFANHMNLNNVARLLQDGTNLLKLVNWISFFA